MNLLKKKFLLVTLINNYEFIVLKKKIKNLIKFNNFDINYNKNVNNNYNFNNTINYLNTNSINIPIFLKLF